MNERDPIPVDTVEPPLEPAVRQPPTIRLWALVIGGPVTWIVHFAGVYLLAEAACTADRSAGIGFVGGGALRLVVVLLTVVAIVVCLGLAVGARRESARRGAPEVIGIGVPLAVGAAVAVAVTCLPILVLTPC